MPKLSRLVGWLPLHAFLFLLSFYKLRSSSLTLLLLVSDPNRQRPCGSPKVPDSILVVAVALTL